MTIRFHCSQCGVSIKAPRHRAGAKLPCPKCGTLVAVPAPAATSNDAAQFANLVASLESDKEPTSTPPPPVAAAPAPSPPSPIDITPDPAPAPSSPAVTHETTGKQQVRIVDIKLPFRSVFRLAVQLWAIGLLLSFAIWILVVLVTILWGAIGWGLSLS